MNQEFIPYEEALTLKKLGFDKECMASRDINDGNGLIQLPLYQQAFRWFREKHGLIGWVEGKRLFRYCIESNIVTDGQLSLSPFITYEEAELACLRKLIEIVKQKL